MNRTIRPPSLTFNPDIKEFEEKIPLMEQHLKDQLTADPELASYLIEEFNTSSDMKIARNGRSTKDWFKNAETNEIVPLAFIVRKSLIPDEYTGEPLPDENIINSRWLFCVFSNVFALCQFQHIEDGRDQTHNIASALSEKIFMLAPGISNMNFGLGDIHATAAYKETTDYSEYTIDFIYEGMAFHFTTKVTPSFQFNLEFFAAIPNYTHTELIQTVIACALSQVNAVHGCLDTPTARQLSESIRKLNGKKPHIAWKNKGVVLKAEKFKAPVTDVAGFKMTTTSDHFSSEFELFAVKKSDDNGVPPSFQLTHTCRLL